MDREIFKERLLVIMEQKSHWAWPAFSSGITPKSKMLIHFQQEYATYVRDFPVLVARAYVQCPSPAVRRELAENIYEEETGGLVAGKPHPELFLEYPKGMGFDIRSFESINLLDGAQAYRRFLDDATLHRGWEAATAVTTLFVEGTPFERGEIDSTAPKRPEPALEDHPLVRHYGLPLASLALTKAHRKVEGEHRSSAWRCLLDGVDQAAYPTVLASMEEAVDRWLGYRDSVALACGLLQDEHGKPTLAP